MTDRLPRKVFLAVVRLGTLLMLSFGAYLVMEGTRFTELMHSSTLTSAGLPTSVLYAATPVSGVLICVYSVAELLGE